MNLEAAHDPKERILKHRGNRIKAAGNGEATHDPKERILKQLCAACVERHFVNNSAMTADAMRGEVATRLLLAVLKYSFIAEGKTIGFALGKR